MVTPTLGAAFTKAIEAGRNLGPRGMPVTLERVAHVFEDARIEVLGVRIPVVGAGLRGLRVGDQVAVSWQRGQPVAAIRHSARRSGAVTPLPRIAPSLIEELFIVGAVGSRTIYFRNANLSTLLTLSNGTTIRQAMEADPDEVKWGTHEDAFFVRAGFIYSIFTLDRSAPGRPFESPPVATLLRTEQPWDGNILLASISASATGQWVTHSAHSDRDAQADAYKPSEGPDTSSIVQTVTVGDSLTRSDGIGYTQDLRVTEAHVEDEDIEVTNAYLDPVNNLILSLTFRADDLVPQPPAVGVYQGIDTRSFHEQINIGDLPPSDPPLGDPTACDGIFLEAVADVAWQAPSPDGDLHTVIVNLTQGRVVWRSCVPTATLTSESETLTPFAASSHSFSRGTNHGFPDPPGIGSTITLEDCFTGPSSPPNFAGNPNVPTSGQPLGAIFLDYAATTKDLHHLHVVDPALLTLVGVTTALETAASSTQVLYTNQSIGQVMSYSTPPVPDPLPIGECWGRVTFSESATVRTCYVEFEILDYLPSLTTVDQGEIFLRGFQEIFAEISGISARETSNLHSLWRINLTTGQVVAIQPWTAAVATLYQTTFPFVRLFGSTYFHILGVSPTFVLWIRFHDLSSSVTNWTVYLTHAIPGQPSLGTSTVFEVTNNGSTVPPEFLSFLNEDVQLLWPDVVFYPPNTRLLESWTRQKVPTLQKTSDWPPIRTEVPAEITALVDYPPEIIADVVQDNPNVMPFNWPYPQTGPSRHVLTGEADEFVELEQ
jgi:hypothetical protein